MKLLVITFILSLSSLALASGNRDAHLVAVGQGIAHPSATSSLSWSNGTTRANPTGVIYQGGLRITGLYQQSGSETGNDGYGGELGYGSGSWGLAAGYYEYDCEAEACEGEGYGAAALEVGNWFSLGIRGQEDLSTVGVVFNSSGRLRLGLVGELLEVEGDDNNIQAMGAGLSWIGNGYAFVVDASTYTFEDDTIEDDRVYVTPGVVLHVKPLNISLNYRTVLNEEDDQDSTWDDDSIWIGVGVGSPNLHFAFYSNYIDDLSFALSFFF